MTCVWSKQKVGELKGWESFWIFATKSCNDAGFCWVLVLFLRTWSETPCSWTSVCAWAGRSVDGTVFGTGVALSLLLDELRNGSMGEVFEIEGSSIEIGSGTYNWLPCRC